MKSSLALFTVLFFADSAQAQRSHSHCRGSAGGGGPQWSYSGQLGGYIFGSQEQELQYEPPREYALHYVTNDGEYIPSTYMDYDEAVALGRQQIAAAKQPRRGQKSVSLGEIARALRASKESKLQANLVQGDSHNLEVCDLKSSSCRRL